MERKETWRDDAICRVRPQEHEADFTVGGERSVDATDRNNNLTPCSPEFPKPVVPIYESTFCLCGNKHFNLRERDQEQEQLLGGETAE